MNGGVLRFTAFGFPVAVDPWFWIVSVLLGIQLPPPLIVVWVGVVFVSVLVHELGHAFVSRSYGFRTHILLYSFGGLTFSEGGGRLAHRKQILLSVAGPFAGFSFAAALYALDELVLREMDVPGMLASAVFLLLYVNFFWGLINLLPVLPLDGGRVMESIVYMIKGARAQDLPLQISVGVGGAVAIYCLTRNDIFLAALFGWMAFNAYSSLQSRIRPRYFG